MEENTTEEENNMDDINSQIDNISVPLSSMGAADKQKQAQILSSPGLFE